MATEATDELSTLEAEKRATLDAERSEAVAKQHTLGKLTARERLDLLVDRGTFLEYGILAGSPVPLPKPTPADGIITGLGKIVGGMGLEGAVEIMYPEELAKAEDREKRRAELTEDLRKRHTARRIARSYGVDDVIDPRDTRPVLIRAVRMMGDKLRPMGIPPKKRGIAPW
ncbi:MAG: hypothetical protein HY268_03610 [Deltaproteobacteria bacterium]|nr:hypothetical protein [Deltaproteobacteria bacterium]